MNKWVLRLIFALNLKYAYQAWGDLGKGWWRSWGALAFAGLPWRRYLPRALLATPALSSFPYHACAWQSRPISSAWGLLRALQACARLPSPTSGDEPGACPAHAQEPAD